MQMQAFDLKETGLTLLSTDEMQTIDGGGLWKWIAAGIAAVVEAPVLVGALALASVVDAAYELGSGVAKGWNSVKG